MKGVFLGISLFALLGLSANRLGAQCWLCLDAFPYPQSCWYGEVDWGWEECDDSWGTCVLQGECTTCEFCDDLQADGTVATGLGEVLIGLGVEWETTEHGRVLRRPCDGTIVARALPTDEANALREEYALIEI